MNLLPIPEPWRDRVIVIQTTEIPESWFSPEEWAMANGFARPRRREEWLLSRMAAKRLAVDRGIVSEPWQCRIDDRRIGSWHLSISHSHGFAAAAIAAEPIGVDIERVRPIDERAAHFFLTERETDALRTTALPDRLIHFWAAKEAGWKQRGGAVATLKGVPLTLRQTTPSGLLFDSAETTRVGDLIIALTC